MANLNNIDGIISTTNSQILSNDLKLPIGFNNERQSGQLSQLYLYSNNANKLYNKYSSALPYKSSYKIGDTQSNFQLGIDDISLISSWQISSKGIQFALKQSLLQGLNAFNETKLYNPLMPIVGTTSLADFGLTDSPTRHIDPSLGGVLGALGLSSVSSLFGIGATPTPPKGTAGIIALSKNSKDGGKGLSRGASATTAYKNFQSKWPSNTLGGGSFLSNAIGAAVGFLQANTLIGTFLPIGQPTGTTYKAVDTKIYGAMLNDTSNGLFSMARLDYSDNSISFDDGGVYVQKYSAGPGIGGNPSNTYSDVVNYDSVANIGNSVLEKSSSIYATENKGKYPSNFNDVNDKSAQKIKDQLNSLLNVVSKNGYKVSIPTYVVSNYKDLSSIKDGINDIGKTAINYTSKKTYQAKTDSALTIIRKGMDTNTPDSINLIDVVYKNGDKYFDSTKTLEYKPYGADSSDLITFHIHDIVNDKYIPFRATVKGIQESIQADWSEVKYINRADKTYTYGGFGRTLNFTFTVVVSSIKELLPTWKKINYLAGLVKPSNYTDGTIYSRFIIPPLINLTIGDLYKNQPALITQVGITIPDDAIWELLDETYAKNNDWFALGGRITWTDSKNKFARFPNQCDISINMNLLEKEMPRTGGSQFGDYYLDKDFNDMGSSGQNSFSDKLYIDQVNDND
jgi:hypothetical protein